jgi:hypothetical protein
MRLHKQTEIMAYLRLHFLPHRRKWKPNGRINKSFLRNSEQWLHQDILFSQVSSKRNRGKQTYEFRICQSAEEISFAPSVSFQIEGIGAAAKILKETIISSPTTTTQALRAKHERKFIRFSVGEIVPLLQLI